MQSISSWLKSLSLEQYSKVFADSDVDLDVLRILGDKDLQDLGVSFGHRKKFLKAIAELNGVEAAAPAIAVESHRRDPVHAEGERRQLTVLFCDMVGFTELANRVDPEVLQRIIRSYEDACAVCITRYEGYVFQRLGDGIVAFFGYPLAHEGEAERAIHAGLEIIESLSKLDVADAGHLAVRIGIATGLVVVSSVEKGAVGETMNLASRLQGIAPVGSIVVSERVHRLAGGSFDYEDLGAQSLKGIARPTRAYRILGVSQAASRFEAATQEGLTPLVGREQEIGLLLERWALAQDGEGQVVLLSGEPGIGKSRILSALRERLEAQGAQALRFQCSPYYLNSAFWPSIDNFERALKFARDELPESKLDKLEALIVTHYLRPLSDVRFIASILSIPCDERYGALPMTPQKFKDETLRALVDLTEAAARKQPSVMLYEDVHWADPTTLEVADLLIDRVRTVPLLIVLTHRPEFQSRWAQHGHVISLNLSKLTRAQSSAMVSRLALGKALPAALLEQILAKTDGVPLFVEELTKSIIESGELNEAGDRYDYSGAAHTITIPATLRDSLMARLDRFMPVKEIAQIGAAIGREFSYELISAIAPMAQAQLDDALARLGESGLAFRRGTPPDAVYTFKHALVQDAAYDSLLKRRRLELHASIARALESKFPDVLEAEPELVAHHYTVADRSHDAIPYWLKAGLRALHRSALKESIDHLTRGLQLVLAMPDTPERDTRELEFQALLGTAQMMWKGYANPATGTAYQRADALMTKVGDSPQQFAVLWGVWAYYLVQPNYEQTLAAAQRALAVAERSGDPGLLVQALSLNCVTMFWLGRYLEAKLYTERVLEIYDEAVHGPQVWIYNHDAKNLCLIYAAKYLWMLGYADQAARVDEERAAQARRLGHPFLIAFGDCWGSSVWHYRGDEQRHREILSALEVLSREQGFPMWAACCTMFQGWWLVQRGDLDHGIEMLDRAHHEWLATGAGNVGPYQRALLADAYSRAGHDVEAREWIDAAIEWVGRVNERCHEAEVHRLNGDILLRRRPRDEAGAEVAYLDSLRVARRQEARGWELRTATSLARLWLSQGKRKEAHDLLAPIYGWFTEGFDTKDLKEAKALLGELSG